MVNWKKERNNFLKICMSAISDFSVGNFLQKFNLANSICKFKEVILIEMTIEINTFYYICGCALKIESNNKNVRQY
jgi:hypothetical protein